MYLPPAFAETNPDVLWEIVRTHPLGLLISQGQEGLVANPIPFEAVTAEEPAMLRAHMAKGNGQWRTLDGQDVLVVFQGTNAYITPQWYASKKEHGKVVPTWNYAMVQVHGRARVIDDKAWLHAQVSRLTDHHEATIANGHAWKASDAPEEFMQSQLKGIIGLEITVRSIDGKLKASQNRQVADREGVVEGLSGQGAEHQLAMAKLVNDAGK